MDPLLLVPLAALVTAPLLAACVRLAPRVGLLDVPGPRSSHARPVPRSGGVAVGAGLLGTLLLLAVLAPGGTGWAAYLLPGLAFLLIGLFDDVLGLSPPRKLGLQVLAATLGVLLGLRWGGTGLGPFEALVLGALAPALTGLWLVATVNLLNMLDGIDWITVTLASVVLGAAAGGGAGPGDGALFAAALGATLALAWANASPARTFAGDAGTHLLGFLVGAAALELPASGATSLPWALASAPLLPGVLDVSWGLVTKRRLGLAWTSAHRENPYQRLARARRSHVRVALRHGLLATAALLCVGVLAPRLGLGACVGTAGLVLALHLLDLGRVARSARTVGSAPAEEVP